MQNLGPNLVPVKRLDQCASPAGAIDGMHIFIDESGTFSLSQKSESVSVVGALVLPTGKMPYFEKLYRNLRRDLPVEGREVKGRKLSEQHVSAVVGLVHRCGGLLETVAIDVGDHEEQGLQDHKRGQELGITNRLPANARPEFVAQVMAFRAQLEVMPLQLYVQAQCMVVLMANVLDIATSYYALRTPNELARFHWTIDAKGEEVETNWERWWKEAVLPLVEARTIDSPGTLIRGGNYDALSRFQISRDEAEQKHSDFGADADAFDLRLLLREDLRFSREPEFGLEVADILTNAIRRSLSGNLQISGWDPIRSIMVNRRGGCLRLVNLGPASKLLGDRSYAPVARRFMFGGRSMLPANFKPRVVRE